MVSKMSFCRATIRLLGAVLAVVLIALSQMLGRCFVDQVKRRLASAQAGAVIEGADGRYGLCLERLLPYLDPNGSGGDQDMGRTGGANTSRGFFKTMALVAANILMRLLVLWGNTLRKAGQAYRCYSSESRYWCRLSDATDWTPLIAIERSYYEPCRKAYCRFLKWESHNVSHDIFEAVAPSRDHGARLGGGLERLFLFIPK
jgi:hypothetical protein